MGIINKFKDFMGVGDDDYDEEEFGTEEKENDFDTDFDSFASEPYEKSKSDWKGKSSRDKKEADNKVVNISSSAQMQVILVKPDKFDDASGIADHLRAKRSVVMNLEATNREVARRLIDFLSGVAYTIGGAIKKVANSTYIITPCNVDLMGEDLLDEIENSGLYF